MSALQRIGTLLIITLFAVTFVCLMTHPIATEKLTPRSTNFQIDMNTADVPTLSLLSGISATIGQYIVEHREKHGPLRSLQDLDNIRFIGPTTMKKIAPYIIFSRVGTAHHD